MGTKNEFVFTRNLAHLICALPRDERPTAWIYACSYGFGVRERNEQYEDICREIDRANNRTEAATAEEIKQIVEHLCEKTGKSFSATAEYTRRAINARFRQGFTLDDFLLVIDYKTEKWGGDPEMEEYLRPQTLFSTKFEAYLEAAKKQKESGDGGSFDTDEFYRAALARTMSGLAAEA